MFVVTKYDLFLPIPPVSDKLAETAVKIAMKNFQWSYTTLLLFNSTLVTGVDLFLRLYNKTQIVGKDRFYPPFAPRTKQYILLGTDISDIEQMFDWMKFHQFDNTGKYIVTCQSQECDEDRAVNIFWKRKVTNVVFFKFSNSSVVGYTYFSPDVTCKPSKPVMIKFSSSYQLFPNNLKNLQNCSITVSTFNQIPYMNITDGKPSGADGDLLLLIAEALNASVKIVTPRIGEGWGKREANGTWTGTFADLVDDVADFTVTSPAITISRFADFQMSIPYYTVNIIWVTHRTPVKPASIKLFYPFETLSQIVLAISFMFVGLCAWFVNSKYWNFFRKTNMRKHQHGVLFYSWMICMGLPSTRLPTKPAFLYMTLIWIWYCFLIRTFYQVCLISSLQGNFYYDQIGTIEEAYDKNYSFGGGPPLKDYYIDYPLIYDNWNNVSPQDVVPTLLNISNLNFVLAMGLVTAKKIIKKHKLQVNILPHNIIISPTVLFFKKFSPLADSINIILSRLIETGFTDKLYSKKYTATSSSQNENSYTPITLKHYTGCYVILLVGWMVSTVLFIIELLFSKPHKNKISFAPKPLRKQI